MHSATDERRQRLATASLRGPMLSLAASVLLLLGCLLSWANVQILFFSKSYAGTHFGEGRVALALAVAALALTAVSATLVPLLAYALPLIAVAAFSLTVWKYHDLGTAFSSAHGFRVGSASAGAGLLLAITASGLLLAASLLAVLDSAHRGRKEN